MAEELMPQGRRQTDRRFGGKVLRCNGKKHPDQTERCHQDGIPDDHTRILPGDAHVDDVCDDQRDQQLK